MFHTKKLKPIYDVANIMKEIMEELEVNDEDSPADLVNEKTEFIVQKKHLSLSSQ